MVRRLQILPRWIIFLIDTTLCAMSVYLAFLLRANFNIYQIQFEKLNEVLVISTFINIIVFLMLRSYAGIIRYTSIQDSVRILTACLMSMAALVTIDIFSFYFTNKLLIPLSVIFINLFCCFLFLITYRLLIKQLYDHYIYLSVKKANVIIYGAGHLGLTTKKVIENDTRSNLRVVAFIDNDSSKVQKKLDGVPIFNATRSGLEKVKKDFRAEQLIIAIENISSLHKNEIVDWCLDNDVHVLSVPPGNQWINGQLRPQQIKDIKIEDLLQRDPIEVHNEIINGQLKNKRLLITGAAGSIGSEIVRQVASFSPGLIILCDQAESALYDLELELKETFPKINIQSFIGDVRNLPRMKQLFELYNPNYVYHAAAYKHVPVMENHPIEAVVNNVIGTKHVAELSVQFGVEKFVMISTDKAVNPTNVMGASKRIAEIYTQSLNNYLQSIEGSNKYFADFPNGGRTRFITTRFGNVLGSSGSVIPRFKMQIEKGGPVTVTHPDITRYFMTIPEACQLVLEAGSMGNGGEVFAFDMGKSVKISDLAKRMINLSGLALGKDITIAYTGLRPGEKLYEELLNDAENTLPTYHQKIMIAKVTEYDFDTINFQVDELTQLALTNDEKAIVSKMKCIVPEYISNNSIFEELDRDLVEVI